jgi:hypothetical protein
LNDQKTAFLAIFIGGGPREKNSRHVRRDEGGNKKETKNDYLPRYVDSYQIF